MLKHFTSRCLLTDHFLHICEQFLIRGKYIVNKEHFQHGFRGFVEQKSSTYSRRCKIIMEQKGETNKRNAYIQMVFFGGGGFPFIFSYIYSFGTCFTRSNRQNPV